MKLKKTKHYKSHLMGGGMNLLVNKTHEAKTYRGKKIDKLTMIVAEFNSLGNC